jgi:hypothetical protein
VGFNSAFKGLKFHYISYSVCSSVLEEEGEEATGFLLSFRLIALKTFSPEVI